MLTVCEDVEGMLRSLLGKTGREEVGQRKGSPNAVLLEQDGAYDGKTNCRRLDFHRLDLDMHRIDLNSELEVQDLCTAA